MNRIKSALSLAVLMLFAACNSSNVGLFYSIESVVAIQEEGRGLEEFSPINSFAEGQNNYYLTTSVLKVRAQGTETDSQTGYSWADVNMPDAHPTALKVLADGNRIVLHAAGETADGIVTGLFELTEFDYGDAADAAWTPVSGITPADGERISNAFFANGLLFAELYSSASGYRLLDITGDLEILSSDLFPVIEIEWDGSSYWALTANSIASSTGATPAAMSTVTLDGNAAFENAEGEPLWAVDSSGDAKIYSFSGMVSPAADELYIATTGGYVFYTVDGGTGWRAFDGDSNSQADRISNGTDFTRFSALTLLPAVFDDGTQDRIIAGTANEGYAFLSGSVDAGGESVSFFDAQDQSSSNLFSTDLYRGNISDLVYAGDPTVDENVLFALTPNAGLWRGTYEENRLIWRRE